MRFVLVRLERVGLALAVVLVATISAGGARAESALVAVATNFSEAMERLSIEFQRDTKHQIQVTTGSTGKLYAQIRNGAPFDAFLAADQRRPELLEESDFAVPGSRFTYALGHLTLWSPDPRLVDPDGRATLAAGNFRRLAMANPQLAPYGAAAEKTLISLGLIDSLRDKIVSGENVGQAHALVATGNAALGFVALSSVLSSRNRSRGSRWDVPGSLHEPIRQDAVLLKRGASNTAARAFLEYLGTPRGREVIHGFGYSTQ